jgi:hypothetical protein
MRYVLITGQVVVLGRSLTAEFLNDFNCHVIGMSRSYTIPIDHFTQIQIDLSNAQEIAQLGIP